MKKKAIFGGRKNKTFCKKETQTGFVLLGSSIKNIYLVVMSIPSRNCYSKYIKRIQSKDV